ncbi:MAG: NAD-dependent epimerase/dehydratase family protein [Pseudomonadota bacterium]
MSVLIVGGTGLTGAHAALHLKAAGEDVTVMSRGDLPASLAGLPHLRGSYLDEVVRDRLGAFDQLVFAAGADIRQQPPDEDPEAFYTRVNSEGVPQFFRWAREAGVQTAVYIGTYYPQVVPDKIDSSPYVRSRHLADTGLRALNTAEFRVCSLNAPFILGCVPGVSLPHLEGLVHYAAGRMPDLPAVAPEGGVNHISSQSMSEAIVGALAHGEGGKAYLVGDENLSWKAYLELFFAAAGNPQDLPVSDQEHPLFPDVILYAGRNATISYVPDNAELGYTTGLIGETVRQVVAAYLPE